MTEAFETACFGIITYVGTARSCFVNAVQCAKQGDFEAAEEQIRQGDEAFTEGHHIHADLLAQDRPSHPRGPAGAGRQRRTQ